MAWEDRFIHWYRKIPYATVYNLSPWTCKSAGDLKRSLQWPSKVVKDLVGQDILRPVALYPRYEKMRTYRYNTFYTLHELSGELNKINSVGEMARSMAEHESGLIDIFLAFLNLYPDYEIDIDTKMKFPYVLDEKEKRYLPDAVIRMRSPQMKTYHFRGRLAGRP